MEIESKVVAYDTLKKQWEVEGLSFPNVRQAYLQELWMRLVDECRDKKTGLVTDEGRKYLEMKLPFYEDFQDRSDIVQRFTSTTGGEKE